MILIEFTAQNLSLKSEIFKINELILEFFVVCCEINKGYIIVKKTGIWLVLKPPGIIFIVCFFIATIK